MGPARGVDRFPNRQASSAKARPDASSAAHAAWFRWLTPAAAALAVSLFVATERLDPGAPLGGRGTNQWLADARLGAQWAAYHAAGDHSPHNSVARPVDYAAAPGPGGRASRSGGMNPEWTNEAASTSRPPSPPLLRTNQLTP